MPHSEYLSPIQDIIADAKAGKMFILVDDEDRENEGDLVIPAAYADSKAVNFMATHGRGLICLAMTDERVDELGIQLMSQHNGTRHQTAFTTSIEAREGVTTGISAADRAQTIKVAIDPEKGKYDIVTPGHVFPLIAREGGVLVRAGHTEAAVDIAKMAGLNPSGVICEIMNDDGTMARLPELIEFAKKHNLKIATIADLIAYRRKNESLVKRIVETDFHSKWGGEFKMIIYANHIEYAEHIALVKGDINPDEPTLVRMHSLDVLRDVLGDEENLAHKQRSLEIISKEGKGVMVLLREPQVDTISQRIKSRISAQEKSESAEKPQADLRDYGIGAQILQDLGVKDITLLAHAEKSVVGLDGYGLKIVGYKEPV